MGQAVLDLTKWLEALLSSCSRGFPLTYPPSGARYPLTSDRLLLDSAVGHGENMYVDYMKKLGFPYLSNNRPYLRVMDLCTWCKRTKRRRFPTTLVVLFQIYHTACARGWALPPDGAYNVIDRRPGSLLWFLADADTVENVVAVGTLREVGLLPFWGCLAHVMILSYKSHTCRRTWRGKRLQQHHMLPQVFMLFNKPLGMMKLGQQILVVNIAQQTLVEYFALLLLEILVLQKNHLLLKVHVFDDKPLRKMESALTT